MLLAIPDMNFAGEAGSGQETLALCRENRPDVILMDIALPGMDGIAATRAIRERCPAAQVVILTGLQQKERGCPFSPILFKDQ